MLEDIPVTIVGGGPVGLALALNLAHHGIASRVAERKPAIVDHPKARGIWVRTMEIFRQWGIEDAVRVQGLPDGADTFVVVQGLGGREFGRSLPEPDLDQSASRKSIVAQHAVEQALLAAVRAQPGADVRLGTEVVHIEQAADGFLVAAADTVSGETHSWRSQFIVGADGGGGLVAKIMGVGHDGGPVLATYLNTLFRADLSRFGTALTALNIFVRRPDGAGAPGLIANINGEDRWLLFTRIGAEHDERERPLTEAETVSAIRALLACPDLEVEIINDARWRISRQIAKQFSKGRIFLVGDAAHRFPPTGGFGLNSGIQDIHNLAWKLAFVIRGQAAERLLETYDLERRPAAHANADLSMSNMGMARHFEEAILSGDDERIRFWLTDIEHYLHNVGHSLGEIYERGALIADGTARPVHTTRVYTPTDRPGGRFPHIWLDEGRTRSSIDLFDTDLTLIVGPDAAAWLHAAARVSEALSIPIKTHRLRAADLVSGIHMGSKGAVLVRPDGIVAWRIGWAVPDPETHFAQVLRDLLS